MTEVKININHLKNIDIGILEYAYLYYLCQGLSLPEDIGGSLNLKNLEEKKYIIYSKSKGWLPTKKAIKLTDIQGKSEVQDIALLTEKYFELFPKGVRSGGYPLRSDRKSIAKKLTKFLKNNPEITEDMILDTTRVYLKEMELKNYQYCSTAEYLIEKDGSSRLLSLIDFYKDKTKEFNTLNSMEETL